MNRSAKLLNICKKIIETKAGLGSSELWTNREFEKLSMFIRDETSIDVSAESLKKIWAKDSHHDHSDFLLNTLAKYAGHHNWRQFALKVLSAEIIQTEHPFDKRSDRHFYINKGVAVTIAIVLLVLIAALIVIEVF